MNSVLQLALTECDKPGTLGTKPLTAMRERRNLMKGAMEAILSAPARENRDLRQSESRDFDLAKTRIGEIDERLEELEYEAKRSASAAEARIGFSEPIGIGGAVASGGETYHRGATSPSWFRDLWHAQRGDADASDRLRRSNREVGMESRALGNTGATGGSGGEFAPPAWLLDQYVKLARPGRVTADLFHREDLPMGVSSVNIPKIATGTTVAQQTTQNTAVAQTDITSTSLSSGVITLAGKQVCSQQLLDQGGIRVDEVILSDLSRGFGSPARYPSPHRHRHRRTVERLPDGHQQQRGHLDAGHTHRGRVLCAAREIAEPNRRDPVQSRRRRRYVTEEVGMDGIGDRLDRATACGANQRWFQLDGLTDRRAGRRRRARRLDLGHGLLR